MHKLRLCTSIIIPTYDRPEDLRFCLQRLTSLVTTRAVDLELIVVDNHPESGLTPPVLRDFPAVRLVSEKRPGLSYARNAGIHASTGEILLFIDDDIVPESGWVDHMLTFFDDPTVLAVTGRVLPFAQQTEAERLFEQHTSFDRGEHPLEFGSKWFRSFVLRSVPAHYVGGGGNSAIRRTAFSDPNIGMFNEVLGAGTPVGSAEDKYMFYRILKSGHQIIYNPDARVLHKHRTTTHALYKQLHAYARAEVAYELECLVNDREIRAAAQLLIVLPVWTVRQLMKLLISRFLRRVNVRSSSLVLWADIAGYMAGLSAWVNSRRRRHRLGRTPLLPIEAASQTHASVSLTTR